MNITKEAGKVRYIVTGEGGLDLRGDDLTWGQACERIARQQRAGTEPAAVLVTSKQATDWAADLRTTRPLDYLLGIPLILSDACA